MNIPVTNSYNPEALATVLTKYAVPDPNIVGKLPKGGRELSFVGHAEITRILIEIDPAWWWEPATWDGGLPAITTVNGFAHMAGTLYLHGVGRIGIGSVQEGKQDIYKELVSDFLRNAAMRFGIALQLWSRQEWDDLKTDGAVKPASKPAPKTASKVERDDPLTDDQNKKMNEYFAKNGLNPVTVFKTAGVVFGKATQADLAALRLTAEKLIAEKEGK